MRSSCRSTSDVGSICRCRRLPIADEHRDGLVRTVAQARHVTPVWRGFNIAVKRVPGDVLHSAALYVLDPRGDLRAAYLFPFAAGSVASDVRRLAG